MGEQMRLEDLSEKTIIDAEGNEVGKVGDVEFDLKERKLIALVVKERGDQAQHAQNPMQTTQKNVTITMKNDIVISFDDVQAMGKFILLKKPISELREKAPE